MVITNILLFNSRTILLGLILLIAFYYSASKVRIPLNKRMPKDILRLKQLASRFIEKLIPWTKDEIELLSLNREDVRSTTKNGFESTGAFTSIYQEPLFSYGIKKYPTRDKFSVLYAQTNTDELFYYEYPKEVEVQFNGVTLGRLIEGKLYGNDGSIIANYLENPIESYTTLVIGNKDVGHILSKDSYNNDVNPRALDLVSSALTKDEERIFIAMIIWRIVKDNVKA